MPFTTKRMWLTAVAKKCPTLLNKAFTGCSFSQTVKVSVAPASPPAEKGACSGSPPAVASSRESTPPNTARAQAAAAWRSAAPKSSTPTPAKPRSDAPEETAAHRSSPPPCFRRGVSAQPVLTFNLPLLLGGDLRLHGGQRDIELRAQIRRRGHRQQAGEKQQIHAAAHMRLDLFGQRQFVSSTLPKNRPRPNPAWTRPLSEISRLLAEPRPAPYRTASGRT